jgi:cell division septum initiation protein DivIVA
LACSHRALGIRIVRNRKQIEERIRFLDEELKAERNAMLKLGTWSNFNESIAELQRLAEAVKKAVELRAKLIKELERL